MQKKPPSRISQIIKLLKETGGPLGAQEMAEKLNLTEPKIRQSIGSSYDLQVVRVGDKLYDLPERAYVGKTFRYSPSWEEITNDQIEPGTDLPEILTLGSRGDRKITVVDEVGEEYILKITSDKRETLGFGLSKLKHWYRKTGFKYGDDILFTCKTYAPPVYHIKRLPKEQRDEAAIAEKSKQLADMVFRQLLKEIGKFCHLMFLIPKYAFLFQFRDPVPPDSLFKALKGDPRFLITDKLANRFGMPIREWIVGIRKYFFENKDGLWVEVSVGKDEFGSHGNCSLCWERLVWNKERGWRHMLNDSEIMASDLTREFFNFDRQETKFLKLK